MFKILSTYIRWKKIYKMQHLEASCTPVLCIGRTVLKGYIALSASGHCKVWMWLRGETVTWAMKVSYEGYSRTGCCEDVWGRRDRAARIPCPSSYKNHGKIPRYLLDGTPCGPRGQS
jgi:hypothetical protein